MRPAERAGARAPAGGIRAAAGPEGAAEAEGGTIEPRCPLNDPFFAPVVPGRVMVPVTVLAMHLNVPRRARSSVSPAANWALWPTKKESEMMAELRVPKS